jgi:hypothetical protein
MNNDLPVVAVSTHVCKVVTGDAVETWTRQGWKLLRVLDTTQARQVQDQVPLCVASGGGGYVSQGVSTSHLVVSEPRFLLEEDPSNSLALATADVAKSAKTASDTQAGFAEVKNALAASATTIRGLQAELARAHADNPKIIAGWNESTATLRKLKEDMAKIRIAVGDLKVKEILDGKA